MATGGVQSHSTVEATGSEAVFDHVCGPCSDDQTKEAVGFCVDCEDWLCEECFRVHKIPKPMRNHVLMNTEEMKTSTQGHTAVDKCTEKCGGHAGKRVKYFCRDHDFLGCSKCFIESHRECKVQNIPNTSTDAAAKTEFKQTTAELAEIAKQANVVVTDVKQKIALVKQNENETVSAFCKYKNELVESLDKIEADLKYKCSTNEKQETERLEKIAERGREIEKSSLQTKSQLEVYEDRGQHCNMFVAMKSGGNKVNTMRESIRKIQASSSVTMYTFQPNLMTSELLKRPEGMGTLVTKGHQRSDTDYSNIQAKLLPDISVKSDGNCTCSITGSALLPDHKLVLVDYSNNEVKVIDTTQNRLLSKTKTDGRPWTVCKISNNIVAVTVNSKNMILFLSIDDEGKLAKTKNISVSGECRGVATTDDKLIVTFVSPEKMEVMDMNGSILKSFDEKHQGQQMFAWPQYAILSPDQKCVYISNSSNNTVTCMRLDGTITAIYKDDELQAPRQIVVDSNGIVFVGGHSSRNIHLITPDCKKIKVVLNKSDKLGQVLAVNYCEESNKLYIGMERCNTMKVFRLT